ncbi:nuclear transport factor 2 family protein [Stieleria sp. JC731]|uniref:nuclear transport factor 2 family protein n=1 Tax=Pirellulaceae TaxID=2691357 RepID=UPI001E55CDCD|nr:nuclear transport factor 2 family protein [Stieleria sp. JC731]MCC9601272.1 nuclear transport factor 2 family protein [Stieleria sp. JC731]
MNDSKHADFISDIRVRFEKGDDAVEGKLAERRNTELVQAIYCAISTGDIEAFRNALSTEIEFEIIGPTAIPFSGKAKGPNDVVALVGKNFGQIESQLPEVQDVVAQGDTVVVNAREHGRLRDAASDYVIDWVQRFRFSDEKLVFFKQVYSRANSPDG